MTDISPETNEQSASPTVLIVDDERNLADLYATWLADTYDVQTAYSGEEALKQLDETIDVMLLDRRMPEFSGDDVLAKLREQNLDCRVVIVSAVTPDFDIVGMGFDDYLIKPVNRDELLDAVDRVLSRTTYDETLQELHQLVSTQATLKAQKSTAELRASDVYADLQEQIEELQAAADAAVEKFTEADFDAAFRDFDSDTHNNPS